MKERIDYLLRLGDSSLVLGQRLAEWTGHGPELEEDIAMTNIALDLVGQARLILSHAGRLEGAGRDEDALAYFRDTRAYRNFTLCELPNSGLVHGHDGGACYAFTVIRNLLYFAWQAQLWANLTESRDTELAAIAAKSAKETTYHLRHAGDWVIRFGDGTVESHARAQRALDSLLPYCNELISPDGVEEAVAAQGLGARGADLAQGWRAQVFAVFEEATLVMPEAVAFCSSGKTGIHSEHLDYLLLEMQSLARAHPGAQW